MTTVLRVIELNSFEKGDTKINKREQTMIPLLKVAFYPLILFQPLSYGATESSLSENQNSEQQTLEIPSQETSKEQSDHLNQMGFSQLSVKVELLPVLYPYSITPVLPISLKFETPIGMKNKKK